MSKIATELRFGSLSSYRYSTGLYDSTKLSLGPLMIQKNGVNPNDNWAGPLPVGIIRPMEYSTAIPVAFPWAMRWSNSIDWIFFADNAAAGAQRRLLHATYNRDTAEFNIAGFVNLAFPTTTNHTVRAFRMTYSNHNTGTVAAQTTVVTGYGTQFLSGIASGNRIGFGSNIPSQISTWYEVSGANSNTLLTLSSPITGVIPSGSLYTIEDLKAINVTTNATAANGGVFITKGLRPEIFTPAGQLIVSGTTVDNQRRTYQLIDNNTVLNTTAIGAGLEEEIDDQTQYLWVIDGTTNPTLYKYNVARNLTTITAGRSIDAFVLKTAAGGVLVGTASQNNNGRLASTLHGPGSGINCLYWTTTTRVYRSNDISTITSGSSVWVADNMVEIPPGGTNTYAASSLMNNIEFSSIIDRFFIPVNATTTPFRSYATRYKTDSSQFDRIWGSDIRQQDQSTADSTVTPVPTTVGSPYTMWLEGGMAYIATLGTTAITNRVYAVPLGADWEYAGTTKSRIITPEISTPNCSSFVRAYVNKIEVLGGETDRNLGLQTGPFKLYYRTAGITDDSGSWTLLEDDGNLSGVTASPSIQFMLEFKVIDVLCIPARILSLTVLYEDLSTLSNYQPSVGNSSVSNKQFAWRFATAFGSTVPTLRVRLYDAVTNGLLVDDNTASPAGTFEKSTNGGSSWGAYDTADKTNENTFIRFTPASLGDNIKVSALLTLL